MKRLFLLLTMLFATLSTALAPARAQAGTVAVLYFENGANPELDMLKIGLAQMLITDLQGTQGLTIVERAQLQAILDKTPLARTGTPDDIARTIAFLMCDAPFITGQILPVDGGRSLGI